MDADPKKAAAALEATDEMVAIVDASFRYELANRAYRAHFGPDLDTLVGRTAAEVLGEEAFERVVRPDLERCLSGETVTFATVGGLPGLGHRRMRFRYVPLREGDQVTAVLATLRDITESTRSVETAHQALFESEERFRRVFEDGPIGMAILGSKDRLTQVNTALARLLGREPAAIAGRSWSDFAEPAEGGKERELAYRLFGGELSHYSVTQRLHPRDGAECWIRKTVSLVHDAAGNLRNSLVIAEDITRERAAETARQKAEQELESQRLVTLRTDRLRALGEMASGMAHELSQPLVGVRGLAEHLYLAEKRGWDMTSDERQADLAEIVAQADRMTAILQHVRRFGSAEERKAQSLLAVNDLVRSSLGLVGAQLRARQIEVSCELMDLLPPVHANRYALEEVLLNLLTNARDALGAREDTRAAQPRRVTLRTSTRDHRGTAVTQIEVIDNGVGIAPDLMERVQEPFFTTKDPQAGSGLGLTVCRSLLGECDGELELESTHGEGTIARVRLPAATDDGGEDGAP